MNTKIKIAAGLLAGIVAGTMLVGTAVAAPRMMASPANNGYRMMRALATPGTLDMPTIAEMNPFMDQYRASNGSIDVSQMHADVASGTVTPPHTKGASVIKDDSASRGGWAASRRGPAMMQGLPSTGGSIGYGMMGSSY
jgi:hypothetical protein